MSILLFEWYYSYLTIKHVIAKNTCQVELGSSRFPNSVTKLFPQDPSYLSKTSCSWHSLSRAWGRDYIAFTTRDFEIVEKNHMCCFSSIWLLKDIYWPSCGTLEIFWGGAMLVPSVKIPFGDHLLGGGFFEGFISIAACPQVMHSVSSHRKEWQLFKYMGGGNVFRQAACVGAKTW